MLKISRNLIITVTLLFVAKLVFISAFSWLLYGSGCELNIFPKVFLPNKIIIDYESLDCDVMAHYEIQSIYARILPSRKRQLLLRFYPTNPDFKPKIHAQADGSIVIEIKEVSQLIYKADLFGNNFVHYRIDHEDYPSMLME